MDIFVTKKIWQPESIQSIFTKLGKRALLIIDSRHYILSEAYPIDSKHEVMLFKSSDNGTVTDFTNLWSRQLISFEMGLAELENSVRNGWRPLKIESL